MRKIMALLLCFMILMSSMQVHSATIYSKKAAEELFSLNLFKGIGTDLDGDPIFDLDRESTRQEAVVMLVRLLGKESEALSKEWQVPFNDVDQWARPYVGYAYANNITKGTSTKTFGSKDKVSKVQYLTLVLRTLDYKDGIDFNWERSFELAEKVGLTEGLENNSSKFTRGDLAVVSLNSIKIRDKTNSVESYQGEALSTSTMKTDFDFLVKTLYEVHPSTLNGFEESQVQIIEKVYSKIQQPLSIEEFYFLINELVVSFKDSHTSLEFPSTQFANIPIACLEEGIVVNHDTDKLKKGDIILSIGNRNTNEIMGALKEITSADNIYSLRAGAPTSLNRAEVLRKLNVVKDDSLSLVVERDGIIKNISVKLSDQNLVFDANENRKWIGWHVDDINKIGYLYFDKSIYGQEFIDEIEAFYENVNKNLVRDIIIDVRRNSGGNVDTTKSFYWYIDIPIVDEYGIGTRFSRQSTELIGTYRSNINRLQSYTYEDNKIPLRIGYFLDWDRSKLNMTNPDDRLLRINYDLMKKYKGDVYILTSPTTASAGAWFATTFKDNGNATVIGEPTGTKPNHYGDKLWIELPNTGFRLDISHKEFYRPAYVDIEEDALYPDLLVKTTAKDILNGIDPQLNVVRSLITAKKDSNINISTNSVIFEDDNLESAVREYIDKPQGEILINDVEGIKELYITGKNIKSLEGLQSLRNLEFLRIDNNQISDLSPLAKLKKLKFLYASNNQISKLDPLAGLLELRYLYLKSNQVTDLSPLKGLNKLNSLSVQENKITKTSPLKYLTNLSSLEIHSNLIEDLDGLESLTKLNYINLYNNKNLSDISGIKNSINLQYFLADNCKIKDISPLSKLVNIGRLELNNNLIESIIDLPVSVIPQKLLLDNNYIRDIGPLKDHNNIYWLSLGSNPIQDIRPIYNLSKIKTIELSNLIISDLSFLSNFTELGYLDLDNSQIADISKIISLKKLRNLDISNNNISDLTGLVNLKELQTLEINNNQSPADYSVIGNLKNLTGLYLQNNRITNVNFLSNLTKLNHLNLENNEIINIEPLNKLTSLITLSLGFNNIKDISPIKGLNLLKYLNIEGNPIKEM